jgi:hypothetical protein
MSRIVIVRITYHRHKPVDLVIRLLYVTAFLCKLRDFAQF